MENYFSINKEKIGKVRMGNKMLMAYTILKWTSLSEKYITTE